MRSICMLVCSYSGSESAILGFASALWFTLSHPWLYFSPLWLSLDQALSAMPTYYSKTLVDDVNELLTTPADKQSIITSWKKILQLLFEGNVMKPEKQLIHCKYILCHPKNRAGFMLNGFNAQANGVKVKRIGANREELHGAVVIELSPFPSERNLQIASNDKVAGASKELIAPPNGQETHMSIGTGHMVCFCRGALHGCKTPFKEIQDDQGRIGLEILKRDGEYKRMLEDGWEFLVMPWQVEATWPNLPEFGQRALNAANSVATDATEWEVAITMHETHQAMDEPDWHLAKQAALSGNPSCTAYGDAIQTIVEKFSGGAGAPLIHEQDEFAKTMGENRRLGETFSKAIAYTELDKYTSLVHVRHALITTNLTSTKVEDNIAKLLTKSDIASLSKKLVEAKAADAELAAARDFAHNLHERAALPRATYIELMGLLRLRYGAHLCGKGKMTFEAIQYKDRGDIMAQFLRAITDHMKENGTSMSAMGVTFPRSLQFGLLATDQPSEDKQPEAAKLLSIDEVNDKTYIAKCKGVQVNMLVYEKSVGADKGIYRIHEIGEHVVVKEVDAFKDDLITANVAFDKFMEEWAKHQGDVPTCVAGKWEASYVTNMDLAKQELAKCHLYVALHSAAEQWHEEPMSDAVQLCLKPMGLRAKKDFKAQELCLYPMPLTTGSVGTKHSQTAIRVPSTFEASGGRITFYINPPPQPRDANVEKWVQNAFVSPFFWVIYTTDKKVANAVLKQDKQRDFVLPYITNTKALKPGDKILLHKEMAAAKTKLMNAEVVEEQEDHDDGASAAASSAEQSVAAPAAKRTRITR